VSEATMTKKTRMVRLDDGALWRVALESPKGNVLDGVMIAELTELFREAAAEPQLRAIVLTGEGDDFCYGASVEEHKPEAVEGMFRAFHGLFRQIADSGVPVLAAVRGMCLGGGLELVSFCHRIFAHPEARFGQPEIMLGVFAPVASAILADRIGRGAADDLLLTGRMVPCQEAREMRLVDCVDEHPEEAALNWAEKHLLPRSASSLRFATRAARLDLMVRFEARLRDLECLYLDELMGTKDAAEGIEAFLERRKPNWSNE
jgi:cyclohexa-1,5-dienecarbonyl-CoA hydratase